MKIIGVLAFVFVTFIIGYTTGYAQDKRDKWWK